jgi:alpha-tubulin suppressor-like RCC1 family protein
METQKLKETTLENKYLNSLLNDEEQESNYVYFKNTFIYGWGKNKYGELGLGHTENSLTPR